MSGLLFLTSDDFVVTKGNNGNLLCNNIPGYSLILFYSTQCKHCTNLIPIFKNLPGTINGCQFGMINVSTNKNCVLMSNNTISPITYVPNIILYINKRPYMVYKGPHKSDEIRRFIMEVANKIQNKQRFTQNVNIESDSKSSIPAYSLGHPLLGNDEVCYLVMDKAYDKK